jgi:hypothetical protein
LLNPSNGKRGSDPNILCDGVPAAGTIGYVLRAPDHPFDNHLDMFKALVDSGANVDEYNNIMRNTPRNNYVTVLKNKNFPQDIIKQAMEYKKQ